MKEQIVFERNEMSEILAENFEVNGEKYDPCDFEWSAYQLQIAGYRRQSEVATEILREVRQALLHMILANSMGETYDLEKRFAEIEKKYTEDQS